MLPLQEALFFCREDGTAFNTNALNQLHFYYCKYTNKHSTYSDLQKIDVFNRLL